MPADNVIIVPNGVSESFLRPLPDGAALRASLGIQPDEHVVGLVSSLVAHEGIGTLLEAVKILNDRGVKTRALIVGDGPERTALQRQAAALGLNAIFTGRVPSAKVRDYHAALDVFVVPRTPDRVCQLVTPLKPVEAMASGLPVVVSSVRALSEIVSDRRDRPAVPARWTPARSPTSSSSSSTSPDLRAKLGTNAQGLGRPRPHLGAQRGPLPRGLPAPGRPLASPASPRAARALCGRWARVRYDTRWRPAAAAL